MAIYFFTIAAVFLIGAGIAAAAFPDRLGGGAFCIAAPFILICLGLGVTGLLGLKEAKDEARIGEQSDAADRAQHPGPHQGFFFQTSEGAYFDFRKRKLALTAAERIRQGIPVIAEAPIWAVMMELGEPEFSWLLFALGDGDTILYLSNGVLTGGSYPDVGRLVVAFLGIANRSLKHLTQAKSFPVPAAGDCTFYAITDSGVLMGTGSQHDLGGDRHALSPLYHAGHEVVTQLRLKAE